MFAALGVLNFFKPVIIIISTAETDAKSIININSKRRCWRHLLKEKKRDGFHGVGCLVRGVEEKGISAQSVTIKRGLILVPNNQFVRVGVRIKVNIRKPNRLTACDHIFSVADEGVLQNFVAIISNSMNFSYGCVTAFSR
jgi:hypothetical protein